MRNHGEKNLGRGNTERKNIKMGKDKNCLGTGHIPIERGGDLW